jgi:hypothetical protein
MGVINKLKAQIKAVRADGKITLAEEKKLEKTFNSTPRGRVRAAAHQVLAKTLQADQDKFEVQARADLSKLLKVKVNLPDPAGMAGDGVTYDWVQGGKLYEADATDDDVMQGGAGDCYFLSVLNSMGRNHRDLLKSAIQPLGDGTYNVRFFQPDAQGALQPIKVRVDGQVAFLGSQVQYARSPSQTEIWVSVLEKAYAKWKGGFESIGHGGSPGQVMTDLTGRPHAFQWTAQSGDAPDSAYGRLKAALDAGQMVNVATPENVDALPTGLVKNHAYAVLGYEEVEGVRQLVVRNPWGNTEPGADGRNDGLFRVPADQVAQFFIGAWTA